MKNFSIALRSLFKKGRSNGIKILSLGTGLALGIVLIAKVCFERSFDSFYPDTDRIYRIHESFDKDGNGRYAFIPGAVAPGMQAEIPEVEVATRLTRCNENGQEMISTPDKRRFKLQNPLIADSTLFDIFPTKIYVGNPKDILVRPQYAMVCRSLAEKMGGLQDIVGKTFVFDSQPTLTFTIGGVYEDVPENAFLRYDLLLSIHTMPQESLNNWVGNDRYYSYVKLRPGVDYKSLTAPMRAMLERHIDMEMLKKSGTDLYFLLDPLLKQYSNSSSVKRMNLLLLFLAFVLIFTAVMNYVLIILSTLIGRAKEVAVHKCYGASGRNLCGMMLSETFLHLLLSLGVAFLLIFVFRAKIEELLDASLEALFVPQTIGVLVGVCALVFVVTGLIPTAMFLRIPVAAAFRNYKESKRRWKLGLLFLQFTATAFLVALLWLIERQYEWMVNDNPGYTYENLLYYNASGTGLAEQERMINELQLLPAVESVSSASQLPIHRISGNNISLPGEDKELFNIADLGSINDHYFPLMEIPVVEGEAFRPEASNREKIMVSRSFEKKMAVVAGWNDGVVGKNIFITGHGEINNGVFTICGVYEDFSLGASVNPDGRPSVYFYEKGRAPVLLIKVHQLSPESIRQVTETIRQVLPKREIEVHTYKADRINLFRHSRNFRDAVMIGGFVTILIALIGLLGYTTDETNRRGREIAIRKVNGATAWDILQLLMKNITWLAIPALLTGALLAYFSGEKWLEQFARKAPVNYFIFAGAALIVYVIILTSVLFRAWKVANENPVDSIKAE